MLPYVLDSNVTKLLSNMLTKPSVSFIILPIEHCNLVAIQIIIIITIVCTSIDNSHLGQLAMV